MALATLLGSLGKVPQMISRSSSYACFSDTLLVRVARNQLSASRARLAACSCRWSRGVVVGGDWLPLAILVEVVVPAKEQRPAVVLVEVVHVAGAVGADEMAVGDFVVLPGEPVVVGYYQSLRCVRFWFGFHVC